MFHMPMSSPQRIRMFGFFVGIVCSFLQSVRRGVVLSDRLSAGLGSSKPRVAGEQTVSQSARPRILRNERDSGDLERNPRERGEGSQDPVRGVAGGWGRV